MGGARSSKGWEDVPSEPEPARGGRTMKARIVGVAVAVLALVAQPAAAATHDDPDDVGGRLDLRQVTRTFSNRPESPPLVHLQSTMYDRWTKNQCWHAEGCTPYWVFDSRQGGGTDVLVVWNIERRSGRRLVPVCEAYNYRTGRRLDGGDADKFRRSAFCTFRKSVLRADKRVRWRALTSWELFTDRAPDSGWYGG
jgi:hypothetical protein